MSERGEGGFKSVLVTALVVLLLALWAAQICFWVSQTFKPAPRTLVAQEGDCIILK